MDTRDRIFDLLDRQKMEQKAFAAAIGVKESAVTDWRRGKSNSYNRYLVQIAQVLGTTTADLLGEEKQSSPSPQRDRLLEILDGLTEAERQDVARYIDFVRSQRKQ